MELLADELVAIARALSIAPERFSEPPDGSGRILLRRRVVDEDDGERRTRCVFLVTAGSGRKLCGLGSLAPSACQSFPAPLPEGAGGDGAGGEATRAVAGCWRRWAPSEVARHPRAADAHTSAMARIEAVAARRGVTPSSLDVPMALLADAALGKAAEAIAPAPAGALPEPRSRSGCATCTTARCCVVFDPEVTGADLLRLVDGLGLAAEDIAELRPTHGEQAGADAIHLGDARAWDLRLRRAATGAPGDARRCGFLVDLGRADLPAAGRCGVYAHRPQACRLFPSDLTELGVMVTTPEAICPPQAWSQERADLETLHALHLMARRERERFRAFVARWNEAAWPLARAPRAVGEAAFLTALIAFERDGPADEVIASAIAAALQPSK